MASHTEKLYLNDSLALEFGATVVGTAHFNGKPSVLLDRSAFYGEAGGQLGDCGILIVGRHRVRVVDTQYDRDGGLHHLVADSLPEPAEGMAARGEVDFHHRRDMMSQHTGQHLLSAVCFEILGAETVSARLGKTSSTLDLDAADVSPDQLARIEEMANDLVLENRQVRPLYPDAEELERMALRRAPKVDDRIRILEIEGFDRTPCGGTHCSGTGQIGPIHITGSERYKGGTRLTFLAGRRAIGHHRALDDQVRELGERLGSGAAGVAEAVAAMQQDLKQTKDRLGETRSLLAQLQCERLHRSHPPTGGPYTPIPAILETDDLTHLRSLASALVKRGDVVALVAARDPRSRDWRVVLERGADADFQAGSWFKNRAPQWGGRGGGRPEKAEGRFPADIDLETIPL